MSGVPIDPPAHLPEAAEYIAAQDRTAPSATPPARAATLVVLAAMLHHRTPCGAVPALTSRSWTGYPPQDLTALQDLHHHRVLSFSEHSPPDAFRRDPDDTLTVIARRTRWEFNGGAAAARRVLDRMTQHLCAHDARSRQQRDELGQLVVDIEVRAVARYADALLSSQYGYPPIGDTSREEFAVLLRGGLEEGWTAGQLIYLAWRAVGASAAWSERAVSADPYGVGTAAVAIFSRRLQQAQQDRAALPEYEIPEWAAPPGALVPGRMLLHRVQAMTCQPAV